MPAPRECGILQLRQEERRDEPDDDAAKRDFVGDDEMFEVNERGANQPGEEDGINERERHGWLADDRDRRIPASSRETPRRSAVPR